MIEIIIIFILLQSGRFYSLRLSIAVIITSTLLFYNLGEIFYRYFYLEHFSLISDIQLLPGLFSMLLPPDLIKPEYLTIFAIIISILIILIISFFILLPVKKYIKRNMPYFTKRELLIIVFSVFSS